MVRLGRAWSGRARRGEAWRGMAGQGNVRRDKDES